MTLREMRVSRGGELTLGEMHEVRGALNKGGLAIVPSDTCYALAGIPFVRGVPGLIDSVLCRGFEKISLGFGSLAMAERFTTFGWMEYRLADEFLPGPLTIVAPIRPDVPNRAVVAELLHTSGTVGVRVTQSRVERQISNELQAPLTTSAIMRSGLSVKHYEDAVETVQRGLDGVDLSDRVPLVAIRHPDVREGDRSTVVERSGPRCLVVHRDGAVDERKLRRVVRSYTPRDVEDWT